ncbi:hypothetical protein HDU98_009191, partial [Podochytrium sp. JEL0797]
QFVKVPKDKAKAEKELEAEVLEGVKHLEEKNGLKRIIYWTIGDGPRVLRTGSDAREISLLKEDGL